jgi:hypothetical protein
MAKASNVDEWVALLLPPHRSVAERLRRMVMSVEPAFRESLKWGNPVYSLEQQDIVYIAGQRQYLQLGFYSGASLADPHHLIEGTGKGMRHIKVPLSADEELLARLRGYVRSAAFASQRA